MDRSRPLDAQFEARLEFDVETVSPSPGNDQSCGESKKIRRVKARRQKKVVATRLNQEGDEDPRGDRTGEVHTIKRPEGSELRVECYGPRDAPPIVCSHGWGANSTESFYQKRYPEMRPVASSTSLRGSCRKGDPMSLPEECLA
jgi:hypothetical protein